MKELISLMISDTFLMIGNIILVFLVITLSVLFVRMLIQNKAVEVLKNVMKQNERQRIEYEESIRRTEGIQEKDNFFYRMDLMLNQSGIKRTIPFFSTEYLILFSMLIGIAGMTITGIFAGFAIGFSVGAVFTVMPYMLLRIRADMNYKKIENQIIHFLNMIENYTKTHDNIITIFGKVYPFLEEPLATAVKECYVEATNTGDMSMAFRKLETKVVHDKFSEILRNLELCSRYEANYQAVVSTSRDIMTNYIKSRKKIKSIADNAKIDFGIIMFCMVILFGMIDSFIENGGIIDVLTSSTAGMVIIAYIVFAVIYGVVSMITLTKK